MKLSTFSTMAALAGLSAAAPVQHQDAQARQEAPKMQDAQPPAQKQDMGNMDVTVLQFALTVRTLSINLQVNSY